MSGCLQNRASAGGMAGFDWLFAAVPLMSAVFLERLFVKSSVYMGITPNPCAVAAEWLKFNRCWADITPPGVTSLQCRVPRCGNLNLVGAAAKAGRPCLQGSSHCIMVDSRLVKLQSLAQQPWIQKASRGYCTAPIWPTRLAGTTPAFCAVLRELAALSHFRISK